MSAAIDWKAITAGVIGVAVLYYLAKQEAGAAVTSVENAVTGAVGAVANAVNPVSQTNIINRGVNAAVQSATGQQGATLGTWLYDVLHPNQP